MPKPQYVVEVTRTDKHSFMLCGRYTGDPDDTWWFAEAIGSDHYWAKLDTLTLFGAHKDHHQWIVDFVIPEMKQFEKTFPPKNNQSQLYELMVYRVDMAAKLNLRYTPMICKTFRLEGEPFNGAVKQGYYHEQ